jgi:hypothetical protein
MYVCLRVAHARDDALNQVKSNPSNKHLYLIPEIHTLAPVQEQKRVKINDSNSTIGSYVTKLPNGKPYFNEGFKVYIHFIDGNSKMENKRLRVAALLQS